MDVVKSERPRMDSIVYEAYCMPHTVCHSAVFKTENRGFWLLNVLDLVIVSFFPSTFMTNNSKNFFSNISNLHQQLTRVFHWLQKPEGKVLKHNLMHRHILTKDMLHHPSPSLAKIISRSNLWNHILDTCAWVPLKSSGS